MCFYQKAARRFFGLPTATPENAVFFPAAMGRNLAAGSFVWVMTILEERRPLGFFFVCWTWAAIADARILDGQPQGRGGQWTQIRLLLVLLVISPLLIWLG